MSQNFGYCQTNVEDTQQFPNIKNLSKIKSLSIIRGDLVAAYPHD